MTRNINLNIQNITPFKGEVVHKVENVLRVRVAEGSSATLRAGSPVSLVDHTGKVPAIDLNADVTALTFGHVIHQQERDEFTAGDFIEVATDGNVILMEAAAAFNAGTILEIVPAGEKVQTHATTGAMKIGLALQKATADGDLVAVLIKTNI